MKNLKNKIKKQNAFTLIELLVCLFLSGVIIALLCQTVIANNTLYSADIVRINLNQNLKSAMTIISANIKEAGENLANSFPAIELRQNENNASSELIVRRNVLDEVLKVCEVIHRGDSVTQIKFSLAGTTSGCIYSDNIYNFNAWKNYRLNNDNIVYPFIYDAEENKGEFFAYKGENDSGVEHSLVTSKFSASNNYNIGASAMYMVEQWRFLLQDDYLVLIENGQDDNPKKIISNVNKFYVEIEKKDGRVQQTFLPENNDMWSDIIAIRVTLGNKGQFMKKDITKTLTASFYPRNILSH